MLPRIRRKSSKRYSRHSRSRFTPFLSKSRRNRRDLVIRLKNDIRRTAPTYGGVFTSHHVMHEEGRPVEWNNWLDIYFAGSTPDVLWNATVLTASKVFWEEAHSRAYDELIAMLTPEEYERATRTDWEVLKRGPTGKPLLHEMKDLSEPVAKLEGLSFYRYWEKLTVKIVRETPPLVHESFEIDPDYAYGVGLTLVIDAPFLTQTNVDAAVRAFLENGSQDWTSPLPIARDRLPLCSEEEFYAQTNPGLGEQEN
jgi:hypothetical protein